MNQNTTPFLNTITFRRHETALFTLWLSEVSVSDDKARARSRKFENDSVCAIFDSRGIFASTFADVYCRKEKKPTNERVVFGTSHVTQVTIQKAAISVSICRSRFPGIENSNVFMADFRRSICGVKVLQATHTVGSFFSNDLTTIVVDNDRFGAFRSCGNWKNWGVNTKLNFQCLHNFRIGLCASLSGFLETIHAMNGKSFHNICLVRVGHSLANFGNPLSTSSLGVTHDVPRKNVDVV